MCKEKDKITTEELHKEIDLIQGCITRMANNSFLLKGWLVSIIAAVVALSQEQIDELIVIVTLIMVTISFWYLDAFFLRTEKLYRKMYEWVLIKRKEGNRDYQYDLKPQRFDGEVDGIFKIMRSNTLKWFYGVILFLIVIVVLFYFKNDILAMICPCVQ